MILYKSLKGSFVWSFFLLSMSCVRYLNAQEVPVLSVLAEKNLQLDNETAYPSAFGSTFQYCEDTHTIAYFNKLTNTIKFFDYNTGTMKSETELEIEGPDGVGVEPFYIHYHNQDSIFVLSRFNNFKLNIVNSKGGKVNSFSFASDTGYQNVPFPNSPMVFGALVVHDGKAYISTQISDRESSNVVAPIVEIDLKSRAFRYLNEPLAYQELDLDKLVTKQQFEFYESRIALNPKKPELVVNFPLEHQLYRISKNGSEVMKSSASKLIGDFRFLKENRTAYKSGSFALADVIYNSAWYFGVLYNPYSDQYYRIGKKEGSTSLLRRQRGGEKIDIPYVYVVSLLDSDLNLIDEITITTRQAIFQRGVFVAPEGLWAVQPNIKGEDILSLLLIGFK